MKARILLCSMLILGSLSYAAETDSIERQLGREELYAKLKEDSKIRWHRDEYKKLLKRFDEYYNKLEQKIADKEQQITELTKLLEVLN